MNAFLPIGLLVAGGALAAGVVTTTGSLRTSHADRPVGGAGVVSTSDSERRTAPADVEHIIRLAGLTPELCATAGFSGADVDRLFDAALAYSLEADRLTQFSQAIRVANIAASNAAVEPARRVRNPDGTDWPALASAQGALDDLRSQALTSAVATIAEHRVQALRSLISASKRLELPPQYLAWAQPDDRLLALRGALASRRFAQARSLNPAPEVTSIIASADADPAVRDAAQNLATNLASAQQTWRTRSSTPTVP